MDHDQVYGEQRAKRLVALLRTLAERITALEGDEELLAAGPTLLKLMGDARSELFHYEVRCTYDTPEIAESRRVVERASRQADMLDLPSGSGFEIDDSEEKRPWEQ